MKKIEKPLAKWEYLALFLSKETCDDSREEIENILYAGKGGWELVFITDDKKYVNFYFKKPL